MYGVTPDVRAMITLTRENPVRSGYRPSHLIGDYRTTGMHTYFVDGDVFPGTAVDGTITFISPEMYPGTMEPGMRIYLYEGSKEVGYADITEIYNDVLRR